jgi:(2Fe-2S) ferredoxin
MAVSVRERARVPRAGSRMLAYGRSTETFLPPLVRHVFVCENERKPDDPRGCCAAKGAAEVRSRLKQLVHDAGLRGTVRVNSAGCLDQCAHGVTVVVYPEAVWYGHVTVDDCDELFREHVIGGRPVTRLRLRHMLPDAEQAGPG